MIFRIYRRALLALRQRFSRQTRNSITTKWLHSARQLTDDAEQMRPDRETHPTKEN